MEQSKTLGEKIRYFRQKANLTQLDLELAINASHGSISRIEQGKVNPTKETIFSVISVLKLEQKDIIELLGFNLPPITTTDITKAKDNVSEYFNKESTISLLIDNQWNIIKASVGMYKLLPFDTNELNLLIGKNLLEVLFDPALKISPFIENKEDFYAYELRLYQESIPNADRSAIIKSLSKFKEFQLYWDLAQSVNFQFYPKTARYIRLNVNGKRITLYTYFRNLNIDSRFELLDYIVVNE